MKVEVTGDDDMSVEDPFEPISMAMELGFEITNLLDEIRPSLKDE